MRALEKKIDHGDGRVALDEGTAYDQIKLDFHIPAIAFLFKYNGREIYDQVVKDELQHWKPGQFPDEAREFKDGTERWSF